MGLQETPKSMYYLGGKNKMALGDNLTTSLPGAETISYLHFTAYHDKSSSEAFTKGTCKAYSLNIYLFFQNGGLESGDIDRLRITINSFLV